MTTFSNFFGKNFPSTPDKIFTNRRVYLNIHSAPGKATPSDHEIVLVKILMASIRIKIPKRRSPRKTNWDNYKSDLTEWRKINVNGETQTYIDTNLDQLTEFIQQAYTIHYSKNFASHGAGRHDEGENEKGHNNKNADV